MIYRTALFSTDERPVTPIKVTPILMLSILETVRDTDIVSIEC